MEIKNKKYFYNNFFRDQIKDGYEEAGDSENNLKYIQSLRINKDYQILDIGTHIGTLIAKLYENGYLNARGIDISEEAINYGQNKYHFLQEKLLSFNGDTLPFPDNTFEVILMFDVIEHIPNINVFLKQEVFRVLKNNGILIFQTPNKITNILWTLFSTKSFARTKNFIINDHCSLQTLTSLKKLLSDSGFNSIIIEKNHLRDENDKNKITKKIGSFFLFLIPLFKILPLFLSPNFWGEAKKESHIK